MQALVIELLSGTRAPLARAHDQTMSLTGLTNDGFQLGSFAGRAHQTRGYWRDLGL